MGARKELTMMTVLYTHAGSSAVQTERLKEGAYLDGNAAGTMLYVMREDGRAIAAFPVSSVLSATYRAEESNKFLQEPIRLDALASV